MRVGPMDTGGTTAGSPSFDPLLRHALDGLLEGCWVISFDERYLYLNDTAAAQGRRPKEQLVGRLIIDCFPGIVGTPVHDAVRRALTLRTHEQLETEYTFPDGEKGWF